MGLLKTLDIGHGYTADGGRTFPFRGKGIGMMPMLPEVFTAIPDGRFLINFKSRRTEEGEALARMLRESPAFRQAAFAVYGGGEPTAAAMEGIDDLPGFSASGMKACLVNYLLLGWSGHVPLECRNTLVTVPVNYAFLLWGWPERFHQRMRDAGSDVILMGPYAAGDVGTSGIDEPKDWDLVPDGFPGYVWTNRIEEAAAQLDRRGFCDREPAPRACDSDGMDVTGG
jgi:glycerophosphoryl diester phosphodiesterase